jgi:hypothetical protein
VPRFRTPKRLVVPELDHNTVAAIDLIHVGPGARYISKGATFDLDNEFVQAHPEFFVRPASRLIRKEHSA